MALLISLLLSLSTLASTSPETELQWAICDSRSGLEIMKLLAKSSFIKQETQVTYFESSRIEYLAKGLSFRRKKGKKDISVVKVRTPAFNTEANKIQCERDRYGDEELESCKLEHEITGREVFSQDQKKFVEQEARVDWSGLKAFGPHPTLEYTWRDAVMGSFAIEELRPKNLTPVIELSNRVRTVFSRERYFKITELLKEKGILLCEKQEGKANRFFRQIQP
jgi:hypothetical protein